MSLVKAVCKAMERVAPLRLAENWDNVGLLLESPIQRPNANRILLTIDLTPSVLAEALRTPTAFIVAYHPPIFKPLTSITLSNPLQSSLLRCAAAGISVFSPHSALDSVRGGVNDWLASGFEYTLSGGNDIEVTLLGSRKMSPEGIEEGGDGRLVKLSKPVAVSDLVKAVKKHLNLSQIQISHPITDIPEVRSIAICAGSGGSMLLGRDADVYFTGEMSHHEILAAVAAGKYVILCGHTNTERGYLPLLAKKLQARLDEDAKQDGPIDNLNTDLEVHVSKEDRHPLVFS